MDGCTYVGAKPYSFSRNSRTSFKVLPSSEYNCVINGRCLLHSSPLYEFEDRLVTLPLAPTTVVMLEGSNVTAGGLDHRLVDRLWPRQLVGHEAQQVSDVIRRRYFCPGTGGLITEQGKAQGWFQQSLEQPAAVSGNPGEMKLTTDN